MLYNDNVPLADTACFTIMDDSGRREAAVAAITVLIEATGSCCSSGENYEGNGISIRHWGIRHEQRCISGEGHTVVYLKFRSKLS